MRTGLTRAEHILKQSNGIFGIAKLLGESGDILDGVELEGISTSIINTLHILDNACYDLIPDVEEDTKEQLEKKLHEANLIVRKIEKAIEEKNIIVKDENIK